MPAIGYLALLMLLGDTLAIPLTKGADRPRRIATAFLVGLVATSWLTYLAALAFASDPAALDRGNLVTLLVGVAVVVVRLARHRRGGGGWRPAWLVDRPDRSEQADWAVIGAITVLVGWMMITTLGFSNGELRIGDIVWSDFGPTTAIAQSFALGHNFPTEYPHFAGLPILYHFMFYFQVGNLTHLGLDAAQSTNLLSIASIVAMLILVLGIGRSLFRSAVVGRIAALLFFVHGSLSFREYLAGFSSVADALQAIAARTAFLPSGFPYRGEDWGVWSQLIFLNQRHLASAIGLLLVGVLFVIEQAADRGADDRGADDRGADGERRQGSVEVVSELAPVVAADVTPVVAADVTPVVAADAASDPAPPTAPDGKPETAPEAVPDPAPEAAISGYLVVGVLLGLLPMWNSAVFLSSAVVFAVLFLALPNRVQMLAVAIPAGLLAFPQLLALRPGTLPQTAGLPAFHWGYVIDDPTVTNVAAYLAFTFGPKLLLAALALVIGTWRQRAVFVAFTALLATAFLVQFSVEVLANHKLINIWLIGLDLFAAAGLVRLWRSLGAGLARRLAGAIFKGVAIVLVAVIATGGLIDLAPVWNTRPIGIKVAGDRLFDWLVQETDPDAVFLTDVYVTHPILLAGRRLYFGWPYYAWSAGYPVEAREKTYREILGGSDAAVVVGLLQREHVDYVAIDDGLRKGTFLKKLNEDLIARSLEAVFTDPEGRYGHLVIYRVPAGSGSGAPSPSASPGSAGPTGAPPPLVDMFTGGRGSGPGQLASARGIAVTAAGEVLVADSDNHRIQRFSASGTFLAQVGGKGDTPGRFNQPNGVAVDSRGHIYVADTTNHRLQEFDGAFTFISEWRGPDPGFYGPRDVVVGPGDVVYVLDQGRGRVVSRALDGTVRSFGSLGSGDGQLRDPTGLAVANGRVYVADAANGRLAIFTTDGAFASAVPIPGWQRQSAQYPDVVVAADGLHLYASSTATDEVLVLDLDGRQTGSLTPNAPDRFVGPGAMAIRPGGGLYVVEFHGERVSLLTTAP